MDYTSISKESKGTEKRNLLLFVPGILSVALLLNATLLGPSTVYNNNNNNKDFIYRGGHVTAEKLTNLWPSKTFR